MSPTKKRFGFAADQVIARRLLLTLLPTLVFFLMTAATAHAHDTRSKGQKVYVPIYSAIGYLSSQNFDLAVTLSFRNLDQKSPITVRSAVYFDTDGKKIKNLLKGARTLTPFATTQVLIRDRDFRGDIGGNIVVEWSADAPVVTPLLEAIMVGARGSQAFSFTSRGVVLE